MTTESKWAERVYRAPKSGRDYTASRVQQFSDKRGGSRQEKPEAVTDSAVVEKLRSEVNDMQLVLNHIDNRIEQFENIPLDDHLSWMQRRIQRLEIVVLMLSSALIIAFVLKALSVIGIDVFAWMGGLLTL
ncbi:MAG: hypothetical protein GY807_08335 [Gammaproteobacteria bacterium]|nr:hypothetical protein [Gammaproteobacteria bacterium]